MDRLQKLHSRAVGWMPTKQFEGKIDLGHVLVAQDAGGRPVGYCVGNDRYYKRDDVGIVFQMNVEPGRQRGLVGATLLRELFARAAWGCRLYCCWCAQDLAANRFWEAMGFVPLAYRAGSQGKKRVHIFWQKRIRRGDEETPYWYPCLTAGGAIREDRVVMPIPPGTHWGEAKRVMLPGMEEAGFLLPGEARPGKRAAAKRRPAPPPPPPPPVDTIAAGGLRFKAKASPAAPAKVEPEKKPAAKHDPKLVAFARELRDRWLERAGEEPWLLEPAGKYDVARALPGESASPQLPPRGQRALPAAA